MKVRSRCYMNGNRTKLVTPTCSEDMFSLQSWFSCSKLFLVYGERQRVELCLTYYGSLVSGSISSCVSVSLWLGQQHHLRFRSYDLHNKILP